VGAARGNRSRHLNLWEAIRLTRKEIDSWKSLSEYIETLFRDLIRPRELRMTNTLSRLTNSLIVHFQNPERDAAESSLLGLWIIQNIDTLKNHPFATDSEHHELLASFSEVLSDDDPIDSQLINLLQRHRAANSNNSEELHGVHSDSIGEAFDQSNTDDSEDEPEEILFDFGWHKKKSRDAGQHKKNTQRSVHSSANSELDDEHDTDFIDPASLDEKIKTSQKSLSVNRLFRQLAKVLHPDREQNDAMKAEKHLLMSQCLDARQRKDIDKLLQLYCEHVGDLPEDLSDSSHQELISDLELQLKLLQLELRQKRYGDALQVQIVERYSDSTNQRIEANVAQHAKQLDREIKQNEEMIEQLKTEAGLQAALIQRRSIELDRMTIDDITCNY